MVGKGGLFLFRLALALALASICLSAYVLSRAQSGPSWEVPVAVVMELQIVPVMSTVMAVCALLLYLWSRRLGSVGAAAQSGFWVVVLVAIGFPLIIWIFQPAQWPFRYLTLSFFAMILIVPTVIAAVVFFWLIGFRWVRSSEK